MERRNHPRVGIRNLSLDASDGVGFFQGVVSDAARFGVRLADLPVRIDEKAKKITIVVSGQGHNFKMKVVPKWSFSQNGSKTIGAEILNPPWGWTEFIMSFEPKSDFVDPWGKVYM